MNVDVARIVLQIERGHPRDLEIAARVGERHGQAGGNRHGEIEQRHRRAAEELEDARGRPRGLDVQYLVAALDRDSEGRQDLLARCTGAGARFGSRRRGGTEHMQIAGARYDFNAFNAGERRRGRALSGYLAIFSVRREGQ